MSREVVITGVGAVSALGVGARTLHERWSAGVVGIEDGKGAATRVRARPSTCPSRRSAAPTASRSSRWSRATRRWPRRAGATSCPTRARRIASILGTGIGGIGTLERGKELLIEGGPKKVPPLSVPLMMSNAAAAAVSMRYKLLGPCHGIVSACSGGADAIGAAKMMIESGLVDAVVTGGSEAALTPLSIAAFDALDALSVKGISRPFDEEPRRLRHGRGRRHPRARGRRQGRRARRQGPGHARGYGASADAYHLTAPDKTGGGPSRAMLAAMEDAGIDARGHRLRQRARHVDGAQRRGRDRGAEDRARRPRVRDPDLVAEVVDRAPARRRRRHGGGGDDPRAARPDRSADARARESRRGPRPGLRPGSAKPLNIDGKPAIAISSSFGFGGHNAVLCLEAA